jgi:predicted enzyme related to lactoylglutathione lyase
MPVVGIGGLFVRTGDPDALSAWYLTHLGVGGPYGQWQQEAGPTVFAPFARDSDYFAVDRGWMLNLRVTDIAALIVSLREAEIAVETRAEWDDAGLGKFARIHDPDGNPIELWEAAVSS